MFVTSYEMNPARVGLAMMLPRLIDLVIDPMLGRISDNLHTRWGRRRPFIVASTVLGTIMMAAVWWVPQAWVNDWRGFVLLTGFAIVLYANLGVFTMAHGALGYGLTTIISGPKSRHCIRSTSASDHSAAATPTG